MSKEKQRLIGVNEYLAQAKLETHIVGLVKVKYKTDAKTKDDWDKEVEALSHKKIRR